MADGEGDNSVRSPQAVTSEEMNLSTIRVVLIIPGIQVKKRYRFLGPSVPSKETDVSITFGTQSLQVSADVTNKRGAVTKFKYNVKKLPGEILKDKCKTEYKKDQIVLTLVKAEELSWAVQLSRSGLEQEVDED
ncbi:hypothetical protein ScPMuIL_007338 [Solemya velum]